LKPEKPCGRNRKKIGQTTFPGLLPSANELAKISVLVPYRLERNGHMKK